MRTRMANTTRISPAEWEALKLASIRGVPDIELAAKFGIKTSSIRSARCRDTKWSAAVTTTKGNAAKIAAPSQIRAENQLSEVISESLEQIAASNPLLLGRYVAKKIKESVTSDILPTPSTWSELQTADKILRTQTGQDKEQAAVTLNLWGGAGAQIREAGGMYEVEATVQESSDFC